MGTLFILLGVALTGLISLSTQSVPTEAELRAAFQEAQKLYAAGDYLQAIAKYRTISQVRSRLLDVSAIELAVGELLVPVSEAALYQSGNAYLKMAEEQLRQADLTGDEQVATEVRRQAVALVEQGAAVFSELETRAGTTQMRVLAQNRLVTSWYQAKDYPRTIREAETLIQKYPQSEYVVEAMYDIAWSHFNLRNYDQSIEAFTALLAQYPNGYRSDRALFQIGEALFEQAKYREAIAAYQQVVDRAAVYNLTERDLLKMRREKLAGLVDETALELAAKAQLKIGDAGARIPDMAQADTAYHLVIKYFSQERRFAEEAYLRLADMYYDQGNLAACVRIYREAIDRIPDRLFQARMQYWLADRYRRLGEFAEAVVQYRLYEGSYGEVAEQAGIPLDKVGYEIGRALYGQGEGGGEGAAAAYRQAIAQFEETQGRYPESGLRMALEFNIALAYQMLDEKEAGRQALARFEALRAAHPEDAYAGHALLQIARLHYRERNFGEATDSYRQFALLVADSSQAIIARFELGIVLRDAGDVEGAVGSFLSVGAGGELFAKSRLEAGAALNGRGQWERALGILEEGLAASTDREDQARFHYLRAKALIGLKRYGNAAAEYSEARVLTADPRLREGALFGRAMAGANAGAYEQAAVDLEELATSADADMRRTALRSLGEVRLRQGQKQEAVRIYEDLAAIAADSTERVDALLLLAELYGETGNPEQVIQMAQAVLSPAVEDRKTQGEYFLKEKALYLLGMAHIRQGDLAEAARVYGQGLARYPGGFYAADIELGLGVAQFQLDRPLEAAATFKRLLGQYPQHPNLAYACYYLGHVYLAERAFAEAAAHFGRVGDEYPQSEVAAEALFQAGECLFNLQQFPQALVRYQQVFGQYPQAELADDALSSAAWTAFELGRPEEGAEYFRRLLAQYPQSNLEPAVRVSLGDYYFNQHDHQRAKAEYLQVQQRFPQDELAERIPQLLAGVRELEAYAEYEKISPIVQEATDSKDEGQLHRALGLLAEFTGKYPGTQAALGALNNIGMCHESRSEWLEAVTVYDQVIELCEAGKGGMEAYGFAKEHREWIVGGKL
ncbi:MAG: tetratricopeptide repeat protein [Candidatus Handelsmanbacteria bacterium]|nr:tetratricopeptide repeat protein [Candidatus Handelsmanbacteria bacterium]